MKLLNDWIPENLLQAMGWTLVHSLWQLVLLAALLWIFLKIAHRAKPSIKYGVSVGGLVLSIGLMSGTFCYELIQSANSNSLTKAELELILSTYPPAEVEAKMTSLVTKASLAIEQNISHLVNFWFLGSILFLLRLFGHLSELKNLRKFSTPASDFQLEKIAYRLAQKMGIKPPVELRITESGMSPLTFGTLRPIVLLPAALIFQLSPGQLEAILAHELAHVKRNDYLVNLLLSGLEVIFFFHPCYWWMSHTVKELREHAADDLAIQHGIEPKNLATGLAEVLHFARQHPPELAQAAGKKRNPTLQRIKRMLGYQTENYPQTPIISIPMLLTLVLSLGLMASAQQDAPKNPASSATRLDKFASGIATADTTAKKSQPVKEIQEIRSLEKNEMVISDGENSYLISGDTLFSGGKMVILSDKAKQALDALRQGNLAPMPEMDFPEAPEFYGDLDMPEVPDFYMDYAMIEAPEMPALAMESMPPMPAMPPMEAFGAMEFPYPAFESFGILYVDTTKMTKAEREKFAKERSENSEKLAKLSELGAMDWAKKSEEWAAKWEEGSAEWAAKMEAWQKEFEPKMKEFELKMQEWEKANEPKMKEFELKMEEWNKAQEPKMKEFELKMQEWEAAQKPKMEEFQRKMEVWQKEHQAKLQEFQKLLKEELKKEDN